MAAKRRSSSSTSLYSLLQHKPFSESLRRRGAKTFFFVFLSLPVLVLFSLFFSRALMSGTDLLFLPNNLSFHSKYLSSFNRAVREVEEINRRTRRVSSIQDSVKSESVLMPDWEVLVVVSPDTPLTPPDSVDGFNCLFLDNLTSVAKFSGVLPFTNRTTFKCIMPNRVRRRRPFLQPILTRNPEDSMEKESPAPELTRWNYVVYESISTEDDVVLFVKGVNNRQGINKLPHEFMCVFGEDPNNYVKTAVTSSVQEVFRCRHPNLTSVSLGGDTKPVKISLEIKGGNWTIPSVAYYTPVRNVSNPKPKSLLCACTMVHNVARFLREWVMYHSKIGIEKFILYDNDSTDDLQDVVKELNQEGYNVTTLLWHWSKTQEAGFSHNAIYSKDTCTWMMYIDVDEFVFSPSWETASQPSANMLKSLLPAKNSSVGQVSMKCKDFGPSGQSSHPVEGVTQGYTCHRGSDQQQRHKSVVLLDAIDESLFNVIHHFGLKREYRFVRLSMKVAVVNHYKYQAWEVFKSKFKRRVSAYVVDWRKAENMKSKDRTPGLGVEPVEPAGWSQMFCDVGDSRLKSLTRRWFGKRTFRGYKMAWER